MAFQRENVGFVVQNYHTLKSIRWFKGENDSEWLKRQSQWPDVTQCCTFGGNWCSKWGNIYAFPLKIIEYIRHSFPFLIKECDVFFCYCTHLLYHPSFVSDLSPVPQVYHATSYTDKNEQSCFWRLPQSAVSLFPRGSKWQTVMV